MDRRAVFLDRDGIVNELCYMAEHGRVETPLNPGQMRLVAGASRGILRLQRAGFRIILVSNQPGVAKRQFTEGMFERIRQRMRVLLAREGVRLDGEYYCLHHPAARRRDYRKRCGCRKPHPGLIMQAAKDRGIDLRVSYMVGDGLVDVEAGRRAGCRTILVGHLSSLLTRIMQRKSLFPTYVAETFGEAIDYIVASSRRDGRRLQPATLNSAQALPFGRRLWHQFEEGGKRGRFAPAGEHERCRRLGRGTSPPDQKRRYLAAVLQRYDSAQDGLTQEYRWGWRCACEEQPSLECGPELEDCLARFGCVLLQESRTGRQHRTKRRGK